MMGNENIRRSTAIGQISNVFGHLDPAIKEMDALLGDLTARENISDDQPTIPEKLETKSPSLIKQAIQSLIKIKETNVSDTLTNGSERSFLQMQNKLEEYKDALGGSPNFNQEKPTLDLNMTFLG